VRSKDASPTWAKPKRISQNSEKCRSAVKEFQPPFRRAPSSILAHAAKHHAGKFTRIDVRFRGALCYIDGYTEPDSAVHLCRLRYFGNEHHWGFAYYKYSSEKYEPSFLLSGKDQGTPEEAFDTSTLFW
jgi:hypothetical protein